MQMSRNYTLYFWLVSIGLVIVKILFTLRPEIDLFTEEAQYWLWSQNMAWHYYSKPPLVAVLNYLSTAILGNTELGVRMSPILLGLGMSWVAFLFGSYLHDRRAGFWAAMVLQAMPTWWLASTFHMTDTSLTFFWLLSIYWTYRGINEVKLKWWVLAGIATAFGIMAKLVMILIFPATLIFLLYTRTFKLQQRNFWAFLGISLMGFVPALIWNWQNNFDTFRHLAALGGAGGGSSKPFEISNSLKWASEYLGGQLAIISAFLLPCWFMSFKETFKTKNKAEIFLLLPGILVFVAFGILSLVKRVEVNWPVFAYTGFAVVLGGWIVLQSKAWRRFALFAIILSIGIPVIFLLPDFTSLKSATPIHSLEKSAFKRLSGHEQVANRLDFLTDSLKLENEFFFSDSYHIASELSFYLAGNPQSYVLNMGSRKNQFDLWAGMDQFVEKENTGIFVSWIHDSPSEYAQFDLLLFEEDFQVLYKGDSLRNTKIQIWKNLKEFNPYVPETY
jgi:hypothetical protein